MTLSMFIKEKVDFRHDQIWLWVCLSKKNLSLDMSKYDFEYVCQKKGLTLDMSTYSIMTLSMFVKGKVDFIHVQIWVWVQSWRKKLSLDMMKYEFEYVCQEKSWL
jgi:hypothetical protein